MPKFFIPIPKRGTLTDLADAIVQGLEKLSPEERKKLHEKMRKALVKSVRVPPWIN